MVDSSSQPQCRRQRQQPLFTANGAAVQFLDAFRRAFAGPPHGGDNQQRGHYRTNYDIVEKTSQMLPADANGPFSIKATNNENPQ